MPPRLAHAAVNAVRPFFNDGRVAQVAPVRQQVRVVRPYVELVPRRGPTVQLQKRHVSRTHHRVKCRGAQQLLQVGQSHVLHAHAFFVFENAARNIDGVSLTTQLVGQVRHRAFGAAQCAAQHAAVVPRHDAVPRVKQDGPTSFAFGTREIGGRFSRTQGGSSITWVEMDAPLGVIEILYNFVKRAGRHAAVLSQKPHVFVGQRDKLRQRNRFPVCQFMHGTNEFQEKPQIEKQVAQVPMAECALLLSENDFIHANPARAVTHPVRNNDHVIRQVKVGLVGLQK